MLALLAFASHLAAQQPQPVVQTSSGTLRGTRQTLSIIGQNQSQQQVYKFLGVPYARAPIGALRFQRPVELAKEQAQTQVDASKPTKTCPQYRHLERFTSPLLDLDTQHQTSEDCLTLNIYVPSTLVDNSTHFKPSHKVPVLVWIPGEGFDFADARQFDGSYLASQTQSVVVTVQYRVGVLGFLSAPELSIPGNMGVYDQLMALRWLHNNVALFGGNPDQVTIMGRFSGSMSISAMITAPKQEQLTKVEGQPLFRRVAMLSGVAVNDWIIAKDQTDKLAELQVAAVARGLCSAEQVARNISCLQGLPAEQLVELAGYGWKLVVDNELIDETGPIEAIKKNQFAGHIDSVLMGETGAEGMLCLYRHLLNSEQSDYARLIEENKMTSNDLRDIISDDSLTYFRYNVTESNPMHIALNAVVEEAHEHQLRDKYIDACSDYMVRSHANRFKRHLESRNNLIERRVLTKRPVQLIQYELRYKPSFSLAPNYIKTAAHGDDIPLIFGLVHKQPSRDVSQADLAMSHKMMSYIGDFVHGVTPVRQVAKSVLEHNETMGGGEPANANQDEEKLKLVLVEAEQRPANWADDFLYGSGQMIITRSQRLVELHRQQTLEDNNLWYLNQRRQQQQQPQQLANMVPRQSAVEQQLAGESSLVTMLLLSSCVLTFGLMSFCFIFSLIVVRCNYHHAKMSTSSPATLSSSSCPPAAHNKSIRANGLGSPSSSCNICIDDSQSECLDAVLRNSGKRDNRGFCNMFAKLRDHRNVEQPPPVGTQHRHQHHHHQQQQQQHNHLAGQSPTPADQEQS